MAKYKHLFFDLDHTLWDFTTNSKAALESLHTDHIRGQYPKVAFEAFYQNYVEVNDIWWSQYRMGKAAKHDLRHGRFRDTLLRFGLADEELTYLLADGYVERSPYQTTLFPGCIELLEEIKKRGYPMHLITNGFEEVQHIKLRESKLRDYFDQVVTSEMVKARKPDPRIFKYALDQAGAQAHESLMIGDSLLADIHGAQAQGIDAVYFNPHEVKHKGEPKFEIHALIDVLSILD